MAPLTKSLKGAFASRSLIFSGSMSGKPEVWVSKSCTRTFSRPGPLNSGRYFCTGSWSETWPRSTRSISMRTVIGLEIDARMYTVSGPALALLAAGVSVPQPPRKTMTPRRATRTEAAVTRRLLVSSARIWFTISRRRADMPTCSGLPTFSTRSSARIEAARIATVRAATNSKRQEREGCSFIGSTPRKVWRVRAVASLRLHGRAPLFECLGHAHQGIIRLPCNGQRFNGQVAAVPGLACDLHDSLEIGPDLRAFAWHVRLDLPVHRKRGDEGDVLVRVRCREGAGIDDDTEPLR